MSTTRPGDDGVLRTLVEDRVTAAGRSGVSIDSLLTTPGIDSDRESVEKALASLADEGTTVLWNDRWLAVEMTDFLVGRVQQLERGDAVLRSGDAGEVGYFIAKRSLRSARDGDLVLARRATRRRRGRTQRLPEATVMKVVSSRVDALVGSVERGRRGLELVPFDPRLVLDIDVRPGDGVESGVYVVTRADPESVPRGGRAQVVVTEVLGSLDEPGVDVLATLRHFEIPDEFPGAVSAAAEALPLDPEPETWSGRRDLRPETTVTIDGETARDFDDAISVRKRREGGYELGVHIADVSHYVEDAGVLDLEAYRRGTSVYFPDRAVPMLPERLSNGLCSLRPGVPRLTLSVFLDVSPGGDILQRHFEKTVIVSSRRLTYGEVRRLLEDQQDGDEEAYREVLPMLRHARDLMRLLFTRRVQRGSIDFDLPEGDVILDLDGAAVGVRPGERTVAHRIIEEFMIAANEAAAQELSSREIPALFRVHQEPDSARLHELRELLEPLGIGLDLSDESLHPRVLQQVLNQVEGEASEPFVASLVLRAMKRARYDPECSGHYALSSRYYTHFTSPIRRYPDLLIHRQLKRLLAGEAPSAEDASLAARLPVIAEHTSATEARAESAERIVLQWKVVRFLVGREGDEFEARVTGVKPYGLFLQLSGLFVDGLLPLSNLKDDFYEYLGERHELVGRRGRRFRLADRLTVRLEEVDVTRRRLLLALPSVGPGSDRISR